MEIPARYFFWFWIAIDIGFLKLGLHAMDGTELLNTVSPSVLFLFKFSSYISAGYSIVYGIIHHPLLTISSEDYMILFKLFALASFVFPLYMSLLVGVPTGLSYLFIYFFKAEIDIRLLKLVFISITFKPLNPVALSISFFIAEKMTFFAGEFLSILDLISPAGPTGFFHKYLLPITAAAAAAADPTQENLFIFNKRKGKKWIEFAVGMAGTILFQNFFRLNSFKEVLVFIYFAAFWLANLVLNLAYNDFGVFNFLLGNVIVGSTVNEFGLGRSTWIAYGTCLLLFGLRLKLESLSLIKREGEETQVVIW